MITATATLQSTITATAQLMSVQAGGCADASVTVNGNAFDDVISGGTLDVPVEYENGTPVGTIVAGVVEIPDPIVCANVTTKNSDNTYNQSTPSGGTLILPDETITLQLDGVTVATSTFPAMTNPTILINWN